MNRSYDRAFKKCFCIFMLLFVSAISVLQANNTYADDSITMTIDTTNINLNLSTTSTSGKFAESTPANISVSTTNSSGYMLSITSSTGTTEIPTRNSGNSILCVLGS